MVKLKVTCEEALKRLNTIPHANFKKALRNGRNWLVYDGNVRARSVLWLFCWAKNGQNSQLAETEARRVFNSILDHKCFNGNGTTFFEWFDLRVKWNYALTNRYSNNPSLDDELDRLLCNH